MAVSGDCSFNSGFMNNYQIEDHIGSGAYGTVYKCTQIFFQNVKEEERVVAVKLVEFTQDDVGKVMREIDLLRKLDHPHVVKIFKSWVEYPPPRHIYHYRPPMSEQSKGAIFIETEFCDFLSLTHWFGENWRKREHAVIFMYQITRGVKYLHEKDIIHRDLKPDNILLRNEPGSTDSIVAKICDFGISRETNKTMTCKVGTFGYVSPEVLKGRNYTIKADVYSLGVMFYEMLVLGDVKNSHLSSDLVDMKATEIFEFAPELDHLLTMQEKSLIESMVETVENKRVDTNHVLHELFKINPKIDDLKITIQETGSSNDSAASAEGWNPGGETFGGESNHINPLFVIMPDISVPFPINPGFEITKSMPTYDEQLEEALISKGDGVPQKPFTNRIESCHDSKKFKLEKRQIARRFAFIDSVVAVIQWAGFIIKLVINITQKTISVFTPVAWAVVIALEAFAAFSLMQATKHEWDGSQSLRWTRFWRGITFFVTIIYYLFLFAMISDVVTGEGTVVTAIGVAVLSLVCVYRSLAILFVQPYMNQIQT